MPNANGTPVMSSDECCHDEGCGVIQRTIQPVMVTVDRSPGDNYLFETIRNLEDSIGGTPFGEGGLIVCDSGSSDYVTEITSNKSLQRDGHDPSVCANLNVCDALEHGAATGADFVLFLEDDIDFIADFFNSVSRWLDDHISSEPIIYPLGANFPEVASHHIGGWSWWKYDVPKFYGTQAFLIRSRDVEMYTTYIREHCYDLHIDGTGYDHLIRDCAQAQGLSHFITPAPSFVQHVGTTSVIKRRDNIHTFPSWPGRDWSYKGIDTKLPTLCVLTPARNARKYLDKYFQQLVELACAVKGYHLRLVVAEGDSVDGTREALQACATKYGIDYTHVDTTHGGKYYSSVEDPQRLRIMSKVMNSALGAVRSSDDIVVWLMVDVEYDANDLAEMVGAVEPGEDNIPTIVAPFVLSGDSLHFWDTWAFRIKGKRFSHQEPYCDYFSDGSNSTGLTEIDSAGTCLIMPASLARNYRATNTEAVSFCNAAREGGHKIYTSPQWVVRHDCAISKLLILGDFGTPGGYSRAMGQVIPELAASGFEIDIIALDWNCQKPHNYPYDIWGVRDNDPLGCQQLYRMLISNTYDAVVVLGDAGELAQHAQVIDAVYKKETSTPAPSFIAWCAVDSENQLAAKSLTTFDHVVVWTDWAKRELKSSTDELPPIHVVPLGVDLSIFNPGSETDRRNARQELLIDASNGELDDKFLSSFVVGMVGRNQTRKQLGVAIAAFAEFTANESGADTYLLLHCAVSNGGIDIDGVAHYYGVGDRVVKFSNWLSDTDMARLYHTMDVLLVTSTGEGFCLPVLEAMACGIRTIIPNAGPLAEWCDVAYTVETTSDCVMAPGSESPHAIGRLIDINDCADVLGTAYATHDVKYNGCQLAESLDVKITAPKFAKLVRRIVDGTLDMLDVELVIKDELSPALERAAEKLEAAVV